MFDVDFLLLSCSLPGERWCGPIRLRLADILVRPMQRLTKYGLLLAAIKKHIADENEGEAIDEMVSVFMGNCGNKQQRSTDATLLKLVSLLGIH